MAKVRQRKRGMVDREIAGHLKNYETMSAVLRTEATDERRGFMKVLVGGDDRILGFTMIGSEAGEVMAAVQTAMLANLPYLRLRDAVISHLTIAEGLGPVLANVPPL